MGEDLRGRVLGEFELVERIGDGGFGVVYLAYQRRLGRKAVVKVLHELLRSRAEAGLRFTREAQLASRLDHRNAAHVYQMGIERDGLAWIAMEYVDGVTLSKWIEQHGPMPLDTFVAFFRQLAGAVGAAHKLGIIHRDIKPSNVMVMEEEGKLVPKLLDFGLAKLLDFGFAQWLGENDRTPPGPWRREVEALRARDDDTPALRGSPGNAKTHWPRRTHAGAFIGSPQFMPPEQWVDAGAVGTAADIYALAVLAYNTLTGRLPFDVEGEESDTKLAELVELHCSAPVPPVGAGLPAELDQVFERALAKRPEDRLASATEMSDAFGAVDVSRMSVQLHDAAEKWQLGRRRHELLWRGTLLTDLEAWLQGHPVSTRTLTPLDHEFIEASRHAAELEAEGRRLRTARFRLAVAGLAGAIGAAVIGAWAWQAAEEAHDAQALSEAKRVTAETTAELEQGRAAELHGDLAGARHHLAKAWDSGERSPPTAFMYARALEPQLAELARLPATSGRMWSTALSPDGKQIVTTDDRNAQIWDAQTYQLLFTLPHGDTVYDAQYDGGALVTASGDGAVRIWTPATGRLVRELRPRTGKRVRYMQVAVAERFIAAIDADGATVTVWHSSTGALIAELQADGSGWPSLAFNRDGQLLAAGGGNDVRIYNTSTWSAVRTIPGPHIDTLVFAPGDDRLATGSTDGEVAIWAARGGDPIRLHHASVAVDAVAFAHPGDLLAVGNYDGTVQVYRPSSGERVSQGNAHGRIRSIEFDRTGSRVLASSDNGAVAAMDVATGLPTVEFDGPRQPITAHFAPGERIIGASHDGSAIVWTATPPYRQWSSLPVSDKCGMFGGAEPDQRFIAVGCLGGPTRVWDTARDQLLAELTAVTPPADGIPAAYPAVTTTGDRAAIARGNAVEVHELPGGRLLHMIDQGAPVSAIAFSPSGDDLVSGGVDGSLVVTRARDSVRLPSSTGVVEALSWLPDGRVVAVDERRLRVIDASRRSVIAELATSNRTRAVRISRAGSRMITIPDYKAQPAPPALWDLVRYQLIAELKGDRGRVYGARFVDDGATILTTGYDGTPREWDAATGRLRRAYTSSLHFSLDASTDSSGAFVVAGEEDGLVQWWDRSTGAPVWSLRIHGSPMVAMHFEAGDLVTRGFRGEVSRWRFPAAERVIDASKHLPRDIVRP